MRKLWIGATIVVVVMAVFTAGEFYDTRRWIHDANAQLDEALRDHDLSRVTRARELLDLCRTRWILRSRWRAADERVGRVETELQSGQETWDATVAKLLDVGTLPARPTEAGPCELRRPVVITTEVDRVRKVDGYQALLPSEMKANDPSVPYHVVFYERLDIREIVNGQPMVYINAWDAVIDVLDMPERKWSCRIIERAPRPVKEDTKQASVIGALRAAWRG